MVAEVNFVSRDGMLWRVNKGAIIVFLTRSPGAGLRQSQRPKDRHGRECKGHVGHLSVHHPNEPDARDYFPDSTAMMASTRNIWETLFRWRNVDRTNLTSAAMEAIRSSVIPEEQKARLYFELMEIEIRTRAVEVPAEITKFGLSGTLSGAFGGMVLLLIVSTFVTFGSKDAITGNHVCILAGILATSVVLYGAFSFERSVRIAADWMKGLKASTDMDVRHYSGRAPREESTGS